MRSAWARLWQSVAGLTAPAGPPSRRMARIGIGFCPGCKRLRATTSPRCTGCGSAAPVTEDA